MPISTTYQPAPHIHELGDLFYDPVRAANFPKAILRFRNDRWAAQVGLNSLQDDEWIQHFGRFQPLPDNLPEALALRYHGHQFRNYNPNLGDGRGFLFAQLRDTPKGRLLDLGTKGSGQTPWSRSGDGRLTLKGGVRELLATELLEARGVNTSKTFSIIETGEPLMRGDEPSPTRSCVLVRLSHSHIRFGAFQRLHFHKDHDSIERLLHYCARHYYPELQGLPTPELAEDFLAQVLQAKAKTVGGWMASGFVHGVLNTDNMNITGESFDYGPWRWLPHVDPGFTAAYFDQSGLYAYERQPSAVLWNLARLAETLLPWSSVERMTAILDDWVHVVTRAWSRHFLALLGLESRGDEADNDFMASVVRWLGESQVPYDQFLFDWYGGEASAARAENSPLASRYRSPAFEEVRRVIYGHAAIAPERLNEAYYQSGRAVSNHIDVVEALWTPIDQEDDWEPLMAHIARIRSSALPVNRD